MAAADKRITVSRVCYSYIALHAQEGSRTGATPPANELLTSLSQVSLHEQPTIPSLTALGSAAVAPHSSTESQVTTETGRSSSAGDEEVKKEELGGSMDVNDLDKQQAEEASGSTLGSVIMSTVEIKPELH